MKIRREKTIREEYVKDKIEIIVNQMVRSVMPAKEDKGRKSYRNICQETGRTRGVIREYGISRLVYRKLSDKGQIEGVRRAS
jgi:small subunit ribosomal protein S14